MKMSYFATKNVSFRHQFPVLFLLSRSKSNLSTLQAKGWVPFVLIAPIGSIEAEPFYAGPMSRVDAGDLLRKNCGENQRGNFVLRKNLRTQLYR